MSSTFRETETRARRGARRSLLLPLLGAAWLGCISLKPDTSPDTAQDLLDGGEHGVTGDASFGVVGPGDAGPADGQGALLLGPPWPNDVPVCWAQAALQTAAQDAATIDPEPSWIQRRVEAGWGHEANLRFGSWPTCPSAGTAISLGVTIASDDGGEEAGILEQGGELSGAGTTAGSKPGEAPKLAFWTTTDEGFAKCATDRLLGRALGLPEDPVAEPLGTSLCGDGSGPLFDMRLSPLQILRARRTYGEKPAGSVVAFDGRCLSASGAATGSIVWTDDCVPDSSGDAGALQNWHFDPWLGSLTLAASGLSLGSNGAGESTQASVSEVIPGLADQSWTTSMASIRGLGGTCVAFEVTPESRVALWPCAGADVTQKFNFGPDSSIRSSSAASDASTTCLTAEGDALVIASCDGSSSQAWTLAPGGEIKSADSGKCLSAVLSDPTNPEVGLETGIPLNLSGCVGGVEQRFDILGVLLAFPAQPTCLDVFSYSQADGSPIVTYPCETGIAGALGGSNEWWDITW